MEFEIKEHYNIDDLINIVNILRSENGCPWDREQTHETLKGNLLEESYEVFDAIDSEDPISMQEELGDVLLQVVFHSAIENENGVFDFDDVSDGICKKLIFRHPHVFGNVKVNNTEDVLKNWEKIKISAKKQTPQQAMENITKALPALLRAVKLYDKARKFNVYTADTKDLSDRLKSTTDSISDIADKQKEFANSQLTEYIGNALFLLTGIASAFNIDPELALNDGCNRFLLRLNNKNNRKESD